MFEVFKVVGLELGKRISQLVTENQSKGSGEDTSEDSKRFANKVLNTVARYFGSNTGYQEESQQSTRQIRFYLMSEQQQALSYLRSITDRKS